MNKTAQIVIPAYQPNFVLFDLISSLVKVSDGSQTIKAGIVVIDDGSTTPEAARTFAKILATFDNVIVLKHKINLGKGSALKSAFTYIKENFHDDVWIVTADADGQHITSDIWRLVEAGITSTTPIIGARKFDTNVPLRSKLGNTVTRYLFNFFYNNKISDTQSGLRGFHCNDIKSLLTMNSDGYAFELDALIYFVKNSKLQEIPIATVYDPGNPTSHFRPLLDSAAIYAVLFRQVLASAYALALETLLFLSLSYLGLSTSLALPTARLIAGSTLFVLARNFVFNSNGRSVIQAFKYIILVILNLVISITIINFVEASLGMSKLSGLMISYIFMFIINFLIQKYLIFSHS